MSEIVDLIKQLVKPLIKVSAFAATVKSVDKKSNTISAAPADGSPELPEVRLTAAADSKGVVCYPAVDSEVLICILDNNIMNAFVALATDVEELSFEFGTAFKGRLNSDGIVFNDGNNGGMINIAELIKLNNYVSALDTVLKAWSPVPGDGGAVLKTALTAGLAAVSPADPSKLADDKIKH